MTELTKYIGPDLDVPSMGYGVGLPEVGENHEMREYLDEGRMH